MSKKLTEKQLAALHYKLLSQKEQKKTEKHLKNCLDCQRRLKIFQYKMEYLKLSEKKNKPSAETDHKIITAIRKNNLEQQQTGKTGKLTKLIFTKPILSAAAMLLVAFSAVIYFSFFSAKDNHQNNILLTSSGQIKINRRHVAGDRLFLQQGDLLTTHKKSRANITDNCFFSISLGEESALKIKTASLKQNFVQKKKIEINLKKGKALFKFKKDRVQAKVKTFNSLIIVTGTRFRISTDTLKTSINLLEGSIKTVNIKNISNAVNFQAPAEIIIKGTQNPLNTTGHKPYKAETNLRKKPETTRLKEKIYTIDGNIVIGTTIKRTDDYLLVKTELGIIKLHRSEIKLVEYNAR